MVLKESVVFLGTKDIPFNRFVLPRTVDNDYLPLYLYSLYQKYQLFAFAHELMRKGAYVSQHVEEVRGLMDRFTDLRHKHWFNEVTRRLTVLENRSRSAGRRAGKVTRPTPPKAMIVSTHHLTAFWFDSALEEKRDAEQSASKFLADSLDVLKETGREGGHPHGLRPLPNRLARTCKSNIEQFEQVVSDLTESDNRWSSDAALPNNAEKST